MARIRKGRIWNNPKVTGDARRRVLVHMRIFKILRAKSVSRSKAIVEARKAEHKGMSKKQIDKYEGRLGALSRYGRRREYSL